MSQLNGLLVQQHGRQIKLATVNAQIESIEPDWRMRFLSIITDPNIAYLLLLLGIYGIFFELINPGFIAPGVIGLVAILIALYAFQLLPINYAGLGLIISGIAFIIAEVFVPGFGILGLGGTVAFVVGSILLIDSDHANYQIGWSIIGTMAAVNITVFILLLRMVMKSRKMPIQHGTAALIGVEGRTLGAVDMEGQAVIRGEIWSVFARQPIDANMPVKVVAAEGLRLEVEAIQGEIK